MSRAGQTPHGARPNRKEARGLGREHVPARCVKPSGRSLEPGSNARPRGMVVPQQQCCGQNSAYRSGCLNLLQSTSFSATYSPELPSCDAGVTERGGKLSDFSITCEGNYILATRLHWCAYRASRTLCRECPKMRELPLDYLVGGFCELRRGPHSSQWPISYSLCDCARNSAAPDFQRLFCFRGIG